MKKIGVGFITICLCLGLSACGKQEDANIVDETVALNGGEVVESAISTEVAESEESVVEETTEAQETEELRIVHYEAKPEIIEAKWYEGMVQVNDVLVQLPIRFNDLIALGFDYEIEGMAKGGELEEYTDYTVYYYYRGEKLFSNEINCRIGKGHTIVDLNPEITTIDIVPELLSDTVKDTFDIYISGGIKMGDPALWIKEKYGEPTSFNGIDVKNYIYEMGFDSPIGLTVRVDSNTEKINGYMVSRRIGINNPEDIASMYYYISSSGSLRLDYFKSYELSWGGRYSLFRYADSIYGVHLNANATTSDLYVETVGDLCYQVTGDDGVFREIRTYAGADGLQDGFSFVIIEGKKMMVGQITFENLSQNIAEDYTAMFLDMVTHMVSSMKIEK